MINDDGLGDTIFGSIDEKNLDDNSNNVLSSKNYSINRDNRPPKILSNFKKKVTSFFKENILGKKDAHQQLAAELVALEREKKKRERKIKKEKEKLGNYSFWERFLNFFKNKKVKVINDNPQDKWGILINSSSSSQEKEMDDLDIQQSTTPIRIESKNFTYEIFEKRIEKAKNLQEAKKCFDKFAKIPNQTRYIFNKEYINAEDKKCIVWKNPIDSNTDNTGITYILDKNNQIESILAEENAGFIAPPQKTSDGFEVIGKIGGDKQAFYLARKGSTKKIKIIDATSSEELPISDNCHSFDNELSYITL